MSAPRRSSAIANTKIVTDHTQKAIRQYLRDHICSFGAASGMSTRSYRVLCSSYGAHRR
jgi:hypothetical protein